MDILEQAANAGISPPEIYATDYSVNMIKVTQEAIDENNLRTVTAQVMDGTEITFDDDTFTHSITNFGIFGFPDFEAGSKHIHRTLKSGGVAAVTVWKRAGNIEFVNKVLKRINPDAKDFWPITEDWSPEAKLRGVMIAGGFEEGKMAISEYEVRWRIKNKDDALEQFNSPFWTLAKAELTDSQMERWNDTCWDTLVEDGRLETGIPMVAWIALATK